MCFGALRRWLCICRFGGSRCIAVLCHRPLCDTQWASSDIPVKRQVYIDLSTYSYDEQAGQQDSVAQFFCKYHLWETNDYTRSDDEDIRTYLTAVLLVMTVTRPMHSDIGVSKKQDILMMTCKRVLTLHPRKAPVPLWHCCLCVCRFDSGAIQRLT